MAENLFSIIYNLNVYKRWLAEYPIFSCSASDVHLPLKQGNYRLKVWDNSPFDRRGSGTRVFGSGLKVTGLSGNSPTKKAPSLVADDWGPQWS